MFCPVSEMSGESKSSDSKKNESKKDPKSELFDRIQQGDVDIVRQLIGSSSVSVNCLDEHGMSPLQHAAFKGSYALCELFLAHGADVNINKHENGYTTLMFAALSGNTEVTRLMLESGAKVSPTNSVGRTAAQMAAFVGQHACVSIINNFFDREQLDYYTKPQGFEKEAKLPPAIASSVYKLILMNNMNPVKLTLFMKNNENLLNEAVKIANVLELICEKMMKGSDTNDVMAMKMHYLSNIVRQCHKWNVEKPKGLDEFLKFLLRARESDGAQLAMEKLLRDIIREFPYHEGELFAQIVRNLADVKLGDEPTALGILTQAINGARSLEVENPCSTCGTPRATKKCSACKAVMYCDQNCQKLQWFTHKKMCQRLGEEHKNMLERKKKEKERELEEERQREAAAIKDAEEKEKTDDSTETLDPKETKNGDSTRENDTSAEKSDIIDDVMGDAGGEQKDAGKTDATETSVG